MGLAEWISYGTLVFPHLSLHVLVDSFLLLRHAKIRDTDGTWKGSSDKSKGKPVKNEPRSNNAGGANVNNGPYIDRINNDAREDEMEENMQEVGNILGNLKNMAKEMGDEIETQNKQIDRVTNKVSFIFFYLIHEAEPQLCPVVITIFTLVVCPSFPTFQNFAKQNKVRTRIVIATGGTVGLAE